VTGRANASPVRPSVSIAWPLIGRPRSRAGPYLGFRGAVEHRRRHRQTGAQVACEVGDFLVAELVELDALRPLAALL